MNGSQHLVTLYLDEQQYAVPNSIVERVVFAVEITPLPEAPEIVTGVIKIDTRIIPIVNIRKRFHLPEREMELRDRFIIVTTPKRTFGFIVDGDIDVVERTEQDVISADKIIQHNAYLEGVLKLKDGMILIVDLETFLNIEEEKSLSRALTYTRGSGETETKESGETETKESGETETKESGETETKGSGEN